MSAAALELREVNKRFGGVLANDAVSLAVAGGAIHALVGENGAGKSTAMCIASGLYAPDRGTVAVDGEACRFSGPQDAIRRGIGMVHQHFMLVETMTVTENVILGAEPGSRFRVDLAGAAARVRELAGDMGLAVDPGARVGDLAVGERQRVELLKALYRRARVLILDEPTAVLAPGEAERLFAVLRRLRAQGCALVLVTHKLAEVAALADAVTVLRAGRVVARREAAAVDVGELARLIVGGGGAGEGWGDGGGGGRGDGEGREESAVLPARRRVGRGEPVLAVRDLAVVDGFGRRAVDGVSLAVHGGEIVGIAGVEGNGQRELVEALAGLGAGGEVTAVAGVGGVGRVSSVGRVSGSVALAGQDLAGLGVRQRRRLGIAHVPEDRQRRGLVLAWGAGDNAILGAHDRPPAAPGRLHLWLDRRAIAARAAALLARFAVRPARLDLPLAAFSGGNQQRLVVGREISPPPRLLLAAQPTRGLDIGGTALVHRELRALRDAGGAVLLVSSELDELLALADRLLVFHRGRIAGELDPASATAAEIGLLMTGGGGGAGRGVGGPGGEAAHARG